MEVQVVAVIRDVDAHKVITLLYSAGHRFTVVEIIRNILWRGKYYMYVGSE